MENEKLRKLREVKRRALLGGGPEKIKKQHARGKYIVRERIEKLLDPSTFEETGMLAETVSVDFGMDKRRAPGDGIVTGYGKIQGRRVCITASDATFMGGSGQSTHIRKIFETTEAAGKYRLPLIQLSDSAGGRVQEGSAWIAYAGSPFYSNTLISGIVPQITAILGRCAGYAAYASALTDFTIMVDKIGQMFITGPKVIKEVTGQEVSLEELGGAGIHSQVSGCADFRVKTEEECFELIRRLLAYLPSSCLENPPIVEPVDQPKSLSDELQDIIPSDPKLSYDMKEVILRLVDNGDFLEVKKEFAQNIITGFSRMNGRSVGIVANQPRILDGRLCANSAFKSARFIRFCDSFNIPILLLIDTPGYIVGVEQEHMGIIRHGAKMLYALIEATVPKLSVVTRKGYGGAVFAMGGNKTHGTDLVFAWPTAEFAVMGGEEAAELLYAEQLAKAADRAAAKKELNREYREKFANPYYLASRMVIHDVIEPRATREKIIAGLEFLQDKKEYRPFRKHGNIPL